MGSEFYAVRSSSPLEDVGEHSFDGIFLTELDVTRDRLVRSIHNVRKSALSDRAKRYSDDVGMPLDGRMPVIVQAMVDKKYCSTGVAYSKFPCPNDIIKVIEDKGSYRTVEAFSRKPRVSWGIRNYPDVGEAVFVSKSFGGIMDHEKDTEGLADLAIGIEKKFGYPVIMEFASRGYSQERNVSILQARKLTMLSEAEKFQVPELQEKGLVASTVDLNGVGDFTGNAFVIKHYIHLSFSWEELEAFDKIHKDDGYVLVTPYLQFNKLELDPFTPNKRATVAYNSLGLHHDYEVARKKGLLYLSCQGCLRMRFHDSIEEHRDMPIKTGDRVRVVSNGEKGFVFNLTRDV